MFTGYAGEGNRPLRVKSHQAVWVSELPD